MADQEVEVSIKQTAQGNAIEETRRKIEELKRAAAGYDEKGMSTAAGSARAEARGLERDLARDARQRAQAEREIAQSRREQAAVARAEGAGGGGMLGGLLGRFVSFGGIAAGYASLANFFVGLQDRKDIFGASLGGRAQMDAFQRARLSGYRGTSSGLQGQVDSIEEEIASRESRRGELDRRAQPWGTRQINKVLRFFGMSERRDFEGAAAMNENEQEIARLQQKRGGLALARDSKFANEEGGLQLAAQRARIAGNFEEAKSLEIVGEGLGRYRSLREAGATEDQAREGASLGVRQRGIDMMRGLGGLASGRDGRANIAALASLGASFNVSKLESLTQQQIDIMEGTRPRKDFTTPPSNDFTRR